jgi:hypothetical protein
MYWYKSKKAYQALAISICLMSGLQACKPDIKETGAKLKYFDLKGYFERDSARLTKLNKPVLKTAIHNGIPETKKVFITNWGTELSLFKASDINRPAWKNSYKVEAGSNIMIYQAKYPELKTREIMIKLVDGKVKWIVIFNYTKNILYNNVEKLSYFPDSLYWIEKKQTVKLLGTNKYQVKGLFNQ